MLQNEMFRNEVRGILGDDFYAAHSHNATSNNVPLRTAGSQAGPGSNRPPINNPNTNTQNTATANNDVDLGIAKALSSMGSAAKRNLMNLATRFNRQNPGTQQQQQTRHYGEAANAREFRPLVDNTEDDDEEADVVSFNNHGDRSRHVLQDTADNTDSENPLFAQQYSGNR
jgi:hypothetical protein